MSENNEERAALQQKLDALRLEHRDLDAVIAQMAVQPSADQLLLRRLKKRKLMLKDRIERLKSGLLPDILA